MSIRSFKQLFGIVFALILCILAGVLGFEFKSWVPTITPSNAFLSALKDQSASQLTFTAVSLGIIGLLSGIVMGPKVADRLINAGNALEAGLKGMSTKDKIAVTFGALLGIFVTLPFF